MTPSTLQKIRQRTRHLPFVRRVRDMEMEALLPFLLSAIGFFGVSPLVVLRAMTGEYAMAVVNAVVTFTFAMVCFAIYRYNAVRPASLALAFFASTGMLANLYLNGSAQIFWAYPIIVSMFLLLRPREAVALTILTVIVATPALMAEESTRVSAVVVLTFINTIATSAAFAALTSAQRRRLREIMLQDPLTGTCNRRAMSESMPDLVANARAASRPISLVMFDIDHFKQVNDQYGHAAGDRVLVEVARCIRANTRASDRLFRVGGEEFVVVIDGAGRQAGQRLGETLRQAVAALAIPSREDPNKKLQVTISLGVAELLPEETVEQWYKRA
ncbi:MAG: diguanylate cyclase, partial [Pseudomonadota bacterium]